MILNVKHKTTYSYSELIKRSVQVIRLLPQSSDHQQVLSWSVSTPVEPFKIRDWFGNNCMCLTFDHSNLDTLEIEIFASGVVETNNVTSNQDCGLLPLEYYLNNTRLTDLTDDMKILSVGYENISLDTSTDIIDRGFIELSANILNEVPYVRGVTNSETSAGESFNLKSGVCQDHSHIMLSIARSIGFPARYVSGYLYTTDTSHVASHAWVEVWYGSAWNSFDVSNQCKAGENHIILAYGLDYSDASPIRGSRVGGGFESLDTYTTIDINQ